MLKQSIIKFPNDFKVIFSGRDSRSVAMCVTIPYGVEKEPARVAGISHVIEKIIKNDLKKQVNRFGGELFTRVTYEFIEISVVTIRDNLTKLMTALSRALFDFAPKMDDLKKAKAAAIKDLEMNKLAPNFILDKITNDNLYKKTGLTNNFYGILASVSKITLDDTKEYLNKIISPNNLVLSVVGDIITETDDEDDDTKYSEVYSLVMEKFYGKLINYKKHNAKFSEEVEHNGKTYNEKTKMLFQDRFEIAFPCASYSSENYKYVRLIDNYVQDYLENYTAGKDYIYGLNVELVRFSNNGHIKIAFAVDSDRAEDVYNDITSQIADIREQGISLGEFEKLKTTYVIKVAFNNEGCLSLARSYAKKLALRGEVFDIDSEIINIRNLDYENFLIVMKDTLSNKNMSVARVGIKRDNFLSFGDK